MSRPPGGRTPPRARAQAATDAAGSHRIGCRRPPRDQARDHKSDRTVLTFYWLGIKVWKVRDENWAGAPCRR
jgi:hypothetical protein